jgi:3-hydroxyisobutyrate dehydrogenase-like beta-hydroxyacid dehydrogenase
MLPPRIGFLGIGIMGYPMALNLLKKGYNLTVYNRTREKCYTLQKEGAKIALYPKDMGYIANVFITMLENEKAMDDVCFSPQGLFETIEEGSYFINMSTVSVDYTMKLKKECTKRKVRFIDCPVSGSKPIAEKGELILLCGCVKEDLDYVKDILLSMGKDIVYCGDSPNGTILKLCINLILATMTVGIVEGVNLCKKSGLDPSFIFEVIEKSPVLNCGYFKIKKDKLLNSDYSTQFSVKNMLKDINFMIELANKNKVNLPVTSKIKEIFENAFKKGFYNEDLIIIDKVYK